MKPTVYYTPESGVGRAPQGHTRRRDGKPLRVGVVSLGAGTLAAYGRPGDRFRFYEINPEVVRLAAGPHALFTFVKHSGADVEIVLGHGRVSLERDTPQRFDLHALRWTRAREMAGDHSMDLLATDALLLDFTR